MPSAIARGGSQGVPMEKQVARFLEQLETNRGFSNNTISAYRNDLKQFLSYLNSEVGLTSWQELNEGVLTGYVLHLREREYARSTIARKVAAVKSFCHFLVDEQLLRADPSETLASPRVDKFAPKSISEESVRLLLEKPAESSTPDALRDKAMLETLYATGMRVSELTALDISDIDLARSEVICGKRPNRERRVPLCADAINSLTAYLTDGRPHLRHSGDVSALFLNHRGNRLTRQGFWLILKSYADACGIADITPHTIRHSFAVHQLANGSEVRDIQQIMGHMSLSTTQIYQQVIGRDGSNGRVNSGPVESTVPAQENPGGEGTQGSD
ncbi:MAG: tyrosine recombinase [Thermomicrobiaceae bacterium]